ncbi:nucleotide sugar dehydrogenase [Brumicola nitratireducens]|uniref:VI polysaccharide biosynthesis protein VipA/tviB n=1 Tax=Glaciecola nitratireducens (strain JCM 12485 / KCTC 12276 / FR1064) TaxID=1085623 RepID=G4QJ33_GLANF|nr:nucleotide sugar dehydrogenase [Glaciecola nitratireducens]AEP28901.1 VI polysaccharide biosynthesis protein VipA/tviB [Glaciecola nitratireducens FR1064]
MKLNRSATKIGVIGLGYVGLPLAVEFGKHFITVGFDTNQKRVQELNLGYDNTEELETDEIHLSDKLSITSDINKIKACNIYIVTVPTPVDINKQPDLTPLINVSEMIAPHIANGNIIIYESTVYPGVTEDICVPILEKISGLVFNKDFFAGYSPERINPGDKVKRLTNIIKVTSGSTPEVAELIDTLYQTIVIAGTHKAPSIKVAEASKVIENVQRDVNIALVNELHQVFNKLGINTKDVIDAAATKWNFMKLMPGMVGGHCISVDPYYLLHKSENAGFIPDLMRTAREINNGMPNYFANDFLRKLILRKINPLNCKILLLGFTFKENCPDIRNTKVYELYIVLINMGLDVQIYDPWVNKEEVFQTFNVEVLTELNPNQVFDVGFLAVAHDTIVSDLATQKLMLSKNFVYDFRGS